MPTFSVVRKSDGVEVYQYNYDAVMPIVGWGFDEYDHIELVPPEEVPPVVPPKILTKLEYLRRFTQEERIAIRTAAAANPVLDDYLRLLELASDVRTDDPDVIGALAMLEAVGLIGAGRAAEILA